MVFRKSFNLMPDLRKVTFDLVRFYLARRDEFVEGLLFKFALGNLRLISIKLKRWKVR